MKVNWKVRLKNKVWLTSFFAAILTFIYTMLGMFDVYPEITKNDVGEIINSLLMFLSLMGVIVDPTTAGLNDSIRAMTYQTPNDSDDQTEQHTVEAEEEVIEFETTESLNLEDGQMIHVNVETSDPNTKVTITAENDPDAETVEPSDKIEIYFEEDVDIDKSESEE